jgi:hypothetical protein
MLDYDQQISENIAQIEQKHEQYNKLAVALDKLNQFSNRTYGLSLKLTPKRGIYYIERGRLKPLSDICGEEDYCSIDKMVSFQLINNDQEKENIKLEITYANNKSIVID